jgi:hypothetical protein
MRIQMNDSRERLYRHLLEATGKGHKSKALDEAARYYLRMAGDTDAYPNGVVDELVSAAVEEGSLTAPEIVAILNDVDDEGEPRTELPYYFAQEWGRRDE